MWWCGLPDDIPTWEELATPEAIAALVADVRERPIVLHHYADPGEQTPEEEVKT